MGLAEAQVQQFRDEGYLVLEALIPEALRRRILAIFDELVERSRELSQSGGGFELAPDTEGNRIAGRLHKVQGVCVVDERVLELARAPEILDRVESLVGPNIDVFGTKFYPMRIKGATSTGWHQDNHYFGTNSDRIVSCATYLEATDVGNGCLRVVPGSHRTGELVAHERGKGIWNHGSWTEVDESQAVDVVCPPGTAVFFSANLLHGARPNVSGRSSYRTAWHYLPGDLNLEMFPRGVYRDRHIVRGS
jgi:ectoine hydroxylase-related dioxygenase (phytanoyl-CoA dioxygenase family)